MDYKNYKNQINIQIYQIVDHLGYTRYRESIGYGGSTGL